MNLLTCAFIYFGTASMTSIFAQTYGIVCSTSEDVQSAYCTTLEHNIQFIFTHRIN